MVPAALVAPSQSEVEPVGAAGGSAEQSAAEQATAMVESGLLLHCQSVTPCTHLAGHSDLLHTAQADKLLAGVPALDVVGAAADAVAGHDRPPPVSVKHAVVLAYQTKLDYK